MNYKPFLSIIFSYKAGKITRVRFEIEWELAQKEQGIRVTQFKGVVE